MYYKICEHCGAALDPQERCDCISSTPKAEETKKENAPSDKAFPFKQLTLMTPTL